MWHCVAQIIKENGTVKAAACKHEIHIILYKMNVSTRAFEIYQNTVNLPRLSGIHCYYTLHHLQVQLMYNIVLYSDLFLKERQQRLTKTAGYSEISESALAMESS